MEKIFEILKKIKDGEYKEDTILFSEGLFDSFDMVMLVNLLMDEYEVKITPADINPANFDTPGSIYKFLGGRR